MSNLQKIIIDGNEYEIHDALQGLKAEDSFIIPKNKLVQYDGSGESRKYVGSYLDEKGEGLSSFFQYNDWGDVKDENGNRTYPEIQNGNCFFSKSNLSKYMENARTEYHLMEQNYKNNISEFYQDRLDLIKELENELLYFSIHDVSDFTDNQYSRAYIRSYSDYWKKLWRSLILPHISYLSILKLTLSSDENNEYFFYFRIFIDYGFRSIVHPGLKYRQEVVSQNFNGTKFKEDVHEYMPKCPFSGITEERMLTASHIKPKQKCLEDGNLDQAMDKLNGLSLTPTYDRLFDRGYISFDDIGNLICGTLLSPITWKRLQIDPSKTTSLRIHPDGREKYLEYHRRFVFQD